MSPAPAPLETNVDHVRGRDEAPLILVYGDFECPYTRVAYGKIARLERRGEPLRFAFRHFPLTGIHSHALGAALAAEGAADQDLYWPMHDALFHRQKALEPDDLRRYASEIGMERPRFDADFLSAAHVARVLRDVRSGEAAGVRGTPTIFIDGARYDGDLAVYGRTRRS